jgi:hypothetical protein
MLAAICIQFRFYWYHWIPFLSFACLGVGIGIAALMTRIASYRFSLSTGLRRVVACLLLTLFLVSGLLGHTWAFRRWSAFAMGRISWETYLATFWDKKMHGLTFVLHDWEVSQALKAMGLQEQTLFIWGYRPLVHYFSGLRASTPFPYVTLLRDPGDRGEGFRRECQEALLAAPPGAILIRTYGNWTQTLDGVTGLLPELQPLLMSRYLLSEKIGPFLVYERIR